MRGIGHIVGTDFFRISQPEVSDLGALAVLAAKRAEGINISGSIPVYFPWLLGTY